ncbi:MAG: c-type cytochrome [Janthinobacterium lividum]
MKKLLAAAMIIGSMGSSAAVLAADASNGQAIVERTNCAACHGAGLNKPISAEYPKLAGQYEDYVYFALRAYQAGGSSSPLFGRNNAIMSAQVQNLSEDDLRDIAAYVQSLPGDLVQKK